MTCIHLGTIAVDPSKLTPPIALGVASVDALPLIFPVKFPVTFPVTSPSNSPAKLTAFNVFEDGL